MWIPVERRSPTPVSTAVKYSRAHGTSNGMFLFTPVRSLTNVKNVQKPSLLRRIWRFITESTQVKNHTRVISAAEGLPSWPTYSATSWRTRARNHTSASIALKLSWVQATYEGTFESTPAKDRTSASSVPRLSQRLAICSPTYSPTRARSRTSVISATGSLSAPVIFARTFAYTMPTTWRNLTPPINLRSRA